MQIKVRARRTGAFLALVLFGSLLLQSLPSNAFALSGITDLNGAVSSVISTPKGKTAALIKSTDDYLRSRLGEPPGNLETGSISTLCESFDLAKVYSSLLQKVKGDVEKIDETIGMIPAYKELIVLHQSNTTTSSEPTIEDRQSCLAATLAQKASLTVNPDQTVSITGDGKDSSLKFFLGGFTAPTTPFGSDSVGSTVDLTSTGARSIQASALALAQALFALGNPADTASNPLYAKGSNLSSNEVQLCNSNYTDTCDVKVSVPDDDKTGRDDWFWIDAFFALVGTSPIGGTNNSSEAAKITGVNLGKASLRLQQNLTKYTWVLWELLAIYMSSMPSDNYNEDSELKLTSGKYYDSAGWPGKGGDNWYFSIPVLSNNWVEKLVSGGGDVTQGYSSFVVRENKNSSPTNFPSIKVLKNLADQSVKVKEVLSARGVASLGTERCGSDPGGVVFGLTKIIPYSICTMVVGVGEAFSGFLNAAFDLLQKSSDVISNGSSTTLFGIPVNVQGVWTENTNLGPKLRALAYTIQNLVNGLVLLLLIIAAFSNIFQVSLGNYGIKKLLPGVLLGFVYSNLSIIIVRALYEVVQVLLNTVMGTLINTSTGFFGKYGTFLGGFIGPASFVDPVTKNIDLVLVLQQGAFNLFTLFAAIIVLILAFAFLLRTVILLLLMSLSPAAFFGLQVAPLNFIWKNWSKNFFEWLFMPLIAFLWIWLGFVFLNVLTTPSYDGAGISSPGFFQLLIGFGIAIFCLLQAIRAPFKLKGDLKVVMDKWQKAGSSSWKAGVSAGTTGVKALGTRAMSNIMTKRARIAGETTSKLDELSKTKSDIEKLERSTEKEKKSKLQAENKKKRIEELQAKLAKASTPAEKTQMLEELSRLGTTQEADKLIKEADEQLKQIESKRQTKTTEVKGLEADLSRLKVQDRKQRALMLLSPTATYALTKAKIKKSVDSYFVEPAKKYDSVINEFAELDMGRRSGMYAKGKAAQKNIDSAISIGSQAAKNQLELSTYMADTEGAKTRKKNVATIEAIKTYAEDQEKTYNYGVKADLAYDVASNPGRYQSGLNSVVKENNEKAMTGDIAKEGDVLTKPISLKGFESKLLSATLRKSGAPSQLGDGTTLKDLGKVTSDEISDDKYIKGLASVDRAFKAMAKINDPQNQLIAENAAKEMDKIAREIYGSDKVVKDPTLEGGGVSYASYSDLVKKYLEAGTTSDHREKKDDIRRAIAQSEIAKAFNVVRGKPISSLENTNNYEN